MKVLVAHTFIMFQNHPTPRVKTNDYVIKYISLQVAHGPARSLGGLAHTHTCRTIHKPTLTPSGGNSFDAISQNLRRGALMACQDLDYHPIGAQSADTPFSTGTPCHK